MINYTKITERLALHEGVRLMPYKDDRGNLTIGVGRCIKRNPFTSQELRALGDWQHGITKNAALMLLRNDVNRIILSLKKEIPFWKNLDDERQYALLDMAFQMGVTGLLRFRKMLAAMQAEKWEEAASECQNSAYGRKYKTRALRIANTIKTGHFNY